MAHPTSLVATLKNAMGSPIAKIGLPLGGLDASLNVVLAHAKDQAITLHEADFHWLSATGNLVFWCSVSDLDRQHGRKRKSKTQSLTDGVAYDLHSIASLRLTPDYGRAAVWSPDGACSSLSVDEYLPHIQDAILRESFEMSIDLWQSHFEFFCDSGFLPKDVPFAWKPFSSKAAALALRSRGLLAAPLHVLAAWENEHARAEAEGSRTWLPEWEDQDALARLASCALERLDEDGFLRAWDQGARQDPSAPMPWAIYGAHMRLARVSLASFEEERTCAWGCSVFEAAMFELCPQALALALARAPLPNAAKEEDWCQMLVNRRHRASLADSAECLRLLVQAGAPLPTGEWMADQKPGVHLSSLMAQIESIALEACVCDTGQPARPRVL